jgi:hypothetical protein
MSRSGPSVSSFRNAGVSAGDTGMRLSLQGSPAASRLREAPELPDQLSALEVREHEDVEQLGAAGPRASRR